MEARAPGFNTRRNRNSLLQTAGDALGIRLNKRKRFSRPPSAIDDVVLEISASKNLDYDWTTIEQPIDESEERERLRDAAAQAVGLQRDNENTESVSFATRPKSFKPPQPLPRYPSNLSALQSFVQTSSSLLKFYPAPSPFLILSRSRQWKTRYLVLTTLQPTRENGATESHLHLFKTNSPDEKELERLSIHQDSVVYMADEEVGGGRQFVLKVGGKMIDASTAKKEEAHSATWLLQMPGKDQMRQWIQFIKQSVLMQKADSDVVRLTLYHNTHNSAGPELKSDIDVMLSMGKQGLLAPPKPTTPGNSGASSPHSGTQGYGDEKQQQQQNGGTSASLGPVSALKGLWNGRPTSRNLSISGSSIATALAPPSSHSQASAQANTNEQDPTPGDGSSAKTRESAMFQIFRPTSPHIPQQPKSPVSTSSTTTTFSEDTTTVPVTTPLGGRFPPSSTSGRPGHMSNSFSMDWEILESASHLGMGSARMKSSTNNASLAPPPRRRPATTGGRQGSPPKELIDDKQSTPPPHLEPRRSLDDEGVISLGMAMGQEPYYPEQEDEDEVIAQEASPIPNDLSPMSTRFYGHEDADSQISAQVPSPMAHTPSLPPSNVSSFGPNASIKTATHDHGAVAGMSRSSTPSMQSETRDDQYLEEDRRSTEYDADGVNQFHLPTGARRRSRLSSLPKQPPAGPLPELPSFHSPPFPAHSPTHEYSSSERPNSSSSIPSTVPSLHIGMTTVANKRISIMSNSDVPSIKSNESSTGSLSIPKFSGGSPFGSNRLTPAGPRTSTFPPPRPAPALPLPPAPLDDMTTMGSTQRHSLSGRFDYAVPSISPSPSSRSEFVQRAIRHSIGPAPPPPTTALPPRPDTIPMSYNHQRSSISSTGPAHLQSLFTIPGSPEREFASYNLPAMAPPPVRPLPPTPFIGDAERPVSPTLSLNSNRSTRSTSALPSFSRMSSLKARLRMMSNPTPSEIERRKVIPPPQPPPNHPPPALPEVQDTQPSWPHVGYHRTQLSNSTADHSQYSSHSPPGTPLGEAITSRLDYPFNSGLPSPPPSVPALSAFTSMALRTHPPPPDMTPLSPPPRRNSRASRDLTPQEKERWKAVVESLDEMEQSSPYSTTPAMHSAINLPATH